MFTRGEAQTRIAVKCPHPVHKTEWPIKLIYIYQEIEHNPQKHGEKICCRNVQALNLANRSHKMNDLSKIG